MLLSILLQPHWHGSFGILDEFLVYCLPLLVLVIILSIASRRARKRQIPRERVRDASAQPTNEDHLPSIEK